MRTLKLWAIVWVFNPRKTSGSVPMPLWAARVLCEAVRRWDYGTWKDATQPIGEPARVPYGLLALLALLVTAVVTFGLFITDKGDPTVRCIRDEASLLWYCASTPVKVDTNKSVTGR